MRRDYEKSVWNDEKYGVKLIVKRHLPGRAASWAKQHPVGPARMRTLDRLDKAAPYMATLLLYWTREDPSSRYRSSCAIS